jgi:hypothetical protein
MLDTRCYACAENIRTEQNMNGKLAEKVYQGNGIFKCPWCGDILNLSKDTYKIKIERLYEEDTLYTEFLELDPKLNNEDSQYAFKLDMDELDIFENISIGKYELEILWYYFECGGFEGEEWDVKIEILSEEELE